jgi:DNA-binding NarL/FixJ family response regulator
VTNPKSHIRVLLVDDHAVVLQGISDILASVEDIVVVGQTTTGGEAVGIVGELKPAVILMDLSMPGMSGVEAARGALAASPESRVLMLSSYSEPESVNAAIDVGAVGYILKDAEPAEIVSAIRAAARGEAPFSPRAAGALLHRRPSNRLPVELTPREREVLQLVAAGLPNKQISHRLGISEKTVKAHLTSVFHRIGVADRVSAAMWASKNLL